MADYTMDWRNGEYVRVDKPRATRVIQLAAADKPQGSGWRVWSKPRGGIRAQRGEAFNGSAVTGVTR